ASQPRLKRENDRDADDEQKCGEDEIGGREAVPICVLHLTPGAGPAVVVHHDHESNGEAAQRVERKHALEWRVRGWDGDFAAHHLDALERLLTCRDWRSRRGRSWNGRRSRCRLYRSQGRIEICIEAWVERGIGHERRPPLKRLWQCSLP